MSLLHQIELAWLESATAAIVAHAEEHPAEEFYAASFWLFYVDYTMFGTPCFAMNTRSHLEQNGTGDRWAPPEWQLPCIDSAISVMQPYYATLSERLAGSSDEVWERTIEVHYACMARLCRHLTRQARAREGAFAKARALSDDFVVGIFELREDEPLFSQLVRASIEPEILTQLPEPLWQPA